LTVEEFDDRHQDHEMVYGVTKDAIHKRITLVFRGTENELAFATNWSSNLYISKTKAEMKAETAAVLQAAVPDGIWFHSGFYNYVFGLTRDPTDAESWRKYDDILEDVKALLKEHPDYKLYVTGHSLGAALASMVAFYLACDPDPDIPKPVTCLNFASPRIGDYNFLLAVQELEQKRWIRFLRVV
jgi:pimeloyl-ACP methyl ester carboxylesterase